MEVTRKVDKQYDRHNPSHAELNLVCGLIKLKGETGKAAATKFGCAPRSHAAELSNRGISCYRRYQRKFSVAGGPE